MKQNPGKKPVKPETNTAIACGQSISKFGLNQLAPLFQFNL